jgi:hypothetical protein
LQKKFSCLLFALGFLAPLVFFFFSEKYEGEGSWITRIYEGEIILKEGVRVKGFRRAGITAFPRVSPEEVRKNLERLVDPNIAKSEKAEFLARTDQEFRSLPPAERERVLGVLTPGELAGAYLSAAGYRVDQVLESSPYLNKSTIPYRYVLVGGIVLIFLGALLLVL